MTRGGDPVAKQGANNATTAIDIPKAQDQITGAPRDPATLLSRLLGNNSNYIVINISEDHPDRLNASQTVRHKLFICSNQNPIKSFCKDLASSASNMPMRVTAEEVCIVLIVFSLWVWACTLFYIRFSDLQYFANQKKLT